MSDFQEDVLIRCFIGGIIGMFVVGMVWLGPWLLIGGATIGAILGWRWWRNKGRFSELDLADQMTIIEWKKLLPQWIKWFEIEKKYVHKKMLYMGDSKDGTIRYWYDDGFYVPQAIDNGEFYWERKVWIENPTLREKLDGFQEMGNEWPAYYQEVVLANKRKKKLTERQTRELMRQGQNKKSAANAFMDEHPNVLLDMKETVEELRKEIEGYCPVIDFGEIK